MVCDGILAQPPLFQKGHRVPHKWLSPGLMSQCLHIQFSMFSRGFRKDPSTYIWSLEGHFAPLPEKKIFCCRQTTTTKVFSSLRTLSEKDPSTIYAMGEAKKCPPILKKLRKFVFCRVMRTEYVSFVDP